MYLLQSLPHETVSAETFKLFSMEAMAYLFSLELWSSLRMAQVPHDRGVAVLLPAPSIRTPWGPFVLLRVDGQ